MEPSGHTYALRWHTIRRFFQKAFMPIKKNLPLSTDVLAEQSEYDTIYNHLNTETNCAQQSSRVVLSLLEIFNTLPRAPPKIDKDTMLNIHKPAEQASKNHLGKWCHGQLASWSFMVISKNMSQWPMIPTFSESQSSTKPGGAFVSIPHFLL